MADLFDNRRGADYRYTDGAGTPVKTVHRKPDKSFPQSGNTQSGVLYRLPDVLSAVSEGRPVYLVEGEKDADAIATLGQVATTAAMGAANFTKADVTPLKSARVIVIPDKDAGGERWLRDVVGALDGIASTVDVVQAAEGKDAADHIAAGHSLEELVPVAKPDPAAEEFQRLVAAELAAQRIRAEASRLAAVERAGQQELPPSSPLDVFLMAPDDPLVYRVADLWPVGGRVMLAAQWKAGKTTLTGNLLRALVDGEPFLGRHDVAVPDGRVFLIDDELDERMARRWLRDQGIRNANQVEVLSLRGRVSTFDILDLAVRERWADKLRTAGASIVVLDCLRPVLDSLGLSEDKDAGQFLVALDELLKAAGVSEALVVHHMGHSGERARGSSRLRDWPDVEWRLVREKAAEDDDVAPDAPRYFTAYGRDVDVPECLLAYDAETRRLTAAGGTRNQVKSEAALPAILEYLEESPYASGRAIEEALKHRTPDIRQKQVRDALKRGVGDGRIDTAKGDRGATLHFLPASNNPSALTALPVRQRGESECVSASIGDALHSLPNDELDLGSAS